MADVTKTLGSVYRWVEVGNRVVFDEDDQGKCTSHIVNKRSGVETELEERNCACVFDMWVKKPSSVNSVETKNRYEALNEEVDQGFTGLDEIF